MTELYRVEIIANQSVMDDITELLEEKIQDFEYTMITGCQGKGRKSKKIGDTVWPEMNFILFAYVADKEARQIKTVVNAVKTKFPNEGISLFFVKAEEL